MSPELQLQLAQLLNAVATVVALILGYQGRKNAKVNRIRMNDLEEKDPEPVTVTGMIRVLRYMDHIAGKERDRRERAQAADQRGGQEGDRGRRSAGAGSHRGQPPA